MRPSAPPGPAWIDAGDDIYVDLASRISQLQYGLQPLIQSAREWGASGERNRLRESRALGVLNARDAAGDLDVTAAAVADAGIGARHAAAHLFPDLVDGSQVDAKASHLRPHMDGPSHLQQPANTTAAGRGGQLRRIR